MNKLKIIVYVLLSLLFLSGTSYAAGLTDSEKNQIQERQDQELIQYQKYQQELENERQRRLDQREIPAVETEEPPQVSDIAGNLPKFTINEIIIQGATLPGKVTKHFLKKPYLNKDLDINDINQLVREITMWYFNRGYITTRATIPKQNLKDGLLTILVKEGYIEDVTFQNNNGNVIQRLTAFPNLKGRRLNIRDIEQGVEQLNRLGSNRAKANLKPSESQTAKSVVSIDLNTVQTNPFQVQYDNFALRPMKLYPRSIQWSIDNLLTINDGWVVGFTQDNQDTAQNSNSQSIGFSLPFGYSLLQFYYSRFEYMTLFDASLGKQKTSGFSETRSARLNQVVSRFQSGKVSYDSGLTLSSVKNYLEDALQNTSSRDQVKWDMGVNSSLSTQLGVWSLGVRYAKGLAMLGADRDDSAIAVGEPRLQFEKTTLNGSWQNRVQGFNLPITLSSTWRIQKATHALYSTEQMSIGDLYSVRGYRNQSITGDDGYLIRNEMSIPVSEIVTDPWYQEKLRGLVVYAALDAGYVRGKTGVSSNYGRGEGFMSGAGLGFRYFGRQLNYDIVYTVPLKAPSFVNKSWGELYFSMGIGL